MPPEFSAYIAPAKAYPQLWRLILGLMLIAGVYFSWMAGLGLLLWLLSDPADLNQRLLALSSGSDPRSLLMLLTTFIGMGLGAWAAARLLHRRGWRSLLGQPPRVLRDFVLGFGAMALVGGTLGLALLPMLPPLQPATPLPVWLAFLPLALLGILLQTGAEELVFRGYLQQQLAARFAHRAVWLFAPATLFGLAHFAPDVMGSNAWLVVAATTLFGLIAGDLTARTGALGLAWGLHFANNILAILVVSMLGGLDGLALFVLPEGAASETTLRHMLLADMAILLAVWAVCRVWLRRR